MMLEQLLWLLLRVWTWDGMQGWLKLLSLDMVCIAQRCEYDKVWLEGDALDVVQQVLKENEGCAPIYLFYYDSRCLSKGFF